MSIQSDKYKALRSKSKTTLIKLAEKYGYNIPKTLNSLSTFGKRLSNFIEKQQYKNYSSGTGEYKKYLKASGLHDTTQARQNFKDIKTHINVAKQIYKQLNNPKTLQYIDPDYRAELMDLVGNKTTLKDYLKSVPKEQLKFDPSHHVEDLIKKTTDDDIKELLKRTVDNVSEKQVDDLLKSFNSKNYGQRFAINMKLNKQYYDEYKRMKAQGQNFDSYQVIKNIIEGV